MSMQDYKKAKELVVEALKKSDPFSTFVGPRSETLVNWAEDRLSFKFPETYRTFLLDYGAGGIGPFEFFGVIQEDFEDPDYQHIDVVWLTLKGRKEWDLPGYLLPIYDLGDGELFCLDSRKKEGNEVKVVGYTPGYTIPVQSLDVVAEDFGTLFLEEVQSALNMSNM